MSNTYKRTLFLKRTCVF